MSTLNLKNRLSHIVGVSAVALLISTNSFAAEVNSTLFQDTVTVVEQNIAKASQELLSNAKQELMLSLQTQIAEQVFDMGAELENEAITQQASQRSVVTAASQK
jgi:hypothetical protein